MGEGGGAGITEKPHSRGVTTDLLDVEIFSVIDVIVLKWQHFQPQLI